LALYYCIGKGVDEVTIMEIAKERTSGNEEKMENERGDKRWKM
jgi:hypothetical protein